MAVSNPARPARIPFSPLSAFAPNRSVSPSVDVRRVSRAIDTAYEALQAIPATDDVRGLIERTVRLGAEVERWVSTPPTPEQCDEVLRSVLAIHIGAVHMTRAARNREISLASI
jgi:hypothetical protein